MSCKRTGSFAPSIYHDAAFAWHQARQVGQETAPMIVEAAEVGILQAEQISVV
jgi:hypothetical protein